MLKQYKGMRIVFFEEIYEKYSRLEFTHAIDRSVGMAGIETRLAKLFGDARYGILNDPKDFSYLPRTLLWKRADSNDLLTKITYPNDRLVPSWSWMAVMGPICFVDIPFNAVRWNSNFSAPFRQSDKEDNLSKRPPQVLEGTASNFVPQATDRIVYDCVEDMPAYAGLKCFILGTDSEAAGDMEKHYGLLILAVGKEGMYERVGVAIFERGKDWEMESNTPVRII